MSEATSSQRKEVDALYAESQEWKINTGEETIHAKRMPGAFRRLKWIAASSWLLFFFWALSTLEWSTGCPV